MIQDPYMLVSIRSDIGKLYYEQNSVKKYLILSYCVFLSHSGSNESTTYCLRHILESDQTKSSVVYFDGC